MHCSSLQPEGGVFRFVPLTMLLLTLAGGLLVVPLSSDAQGPVQVRRIGVLGGGAPEPERVRGLEAFRQSLRDLGWVEGQHLTIEVRWAEGKSERLPDLAAELVQLQVQVIVVGNATVARVKSQATGRIPIVLSAVATARGPAHPRCDSRPLGHREPRLSHPRYGLAGGAGLVHNRGSHRCVGAVALVGIQLGGAPEKPLFASEGLSGIVPSQLCRVG